MEDRFSPVHSTWNVQRKKYIYDTQTNEKFNN